MKKKKKKNKSQMAFQSSVPQNGRARYLDLKLLEAKREQSIKITSVESSLGETRW